MKYFVFALFCLFVLAGCGRTEQEPVAPASPIPMTVYKSPTCGCCADWVEHVEQEGFTTSIEHPQDLNAVKQALGLKPQYASCHTGVTDAGYLFEGHIPAKTIHEFLRNPPKDAIGLAVPGMPVGSPGMEMDDRFSPYSVLLLKKDGSSEVYRRFDTAAAQY